MPVGRRLREAGKIFLLIQQLNFLFDFRRLDGASLDQCSFQFGVGDKCLPGGFKQSLFAQPRIFTAERE